MLNLTSIYVGWELAPTMAKICGLTHVEDIKGAVFGKELYLEQNVK